MFIVVQNREMLQKPTDKSENAAREKTVETPPETCLVPRSVLAYHVQEHRAARGRPRKDAERARGVIRNSKSINE